MECFFVLLFIASHASMEGIDVSRYQPDDVVSLVNPEFVIIKATEGKNYTSKRCDKQFQDAKNLNIPRGVYHYARPSLNSAKEEAEYFAKETTGYWSVKEALLALDWEEPGHKDNTSWALEWLDIVQEKTGVKPLIYMGEYTNRDYNWTAVKNGDYGLWLAKYGEQNDGQKHEAPTVHYWKTYAMWQYTSKGTKGKYKKSGEFDGKLDLDTFYGDVTAWNKYAGAVTQKTKTKASKKGLTPGVVAGIAVVFTVVLVVVVVITVCIVRHKRKRTYSKLPDKNNSSAESGSGQEMDTPPQNHTQQEDS